MEYQNQLLKRKEYFGLLWIASHRPSKISKADVLHMDLTKKCKQLGEYILNNGGKQRQTSPKFSLMISAHLMYGLVIILHKKNVYLYDELVGLKAQLATSFVQLPPKELAKSRKVKVVDKSAITLKENFPEMLDLDSVESILLDKVSKQIRLKSITLEESEDFLNASTMIPVDYDYTMDSFGDTASYMPLIEEAPEVFQPPNKPSYTSTAKKFAQPLKPFTDITNLTGEKGRRVESITKPRDLARESIFGREESMATFEAEWRPEEQLGENLLADLEPVALFEPTMIEKEMPPEQEPVVAEVVEQPSRQMVKTFSADIKQLRESKQKQTATKLARRQPKNLLMDQVTTLGADEVERIKRLIKPTRKGTDEHQTQLEQRAELFQEKKLALLKSYYPTAAELFKAPSGRDARRIDLSDFQLRLSKRNQLIEKCMVGEREPDHCYFYLVEGRAKRQIVPEINVIPEEENRFMEGSMEEKRRNLTVEKLLGLSDLNVPRRDRSSMLKPVEDRTLEALGKEQLHVPQLEQHTIDLMYQPAPQFDSYMEPQMAVPESMQFTGVTEISVYEAMLIEGMGEGDTIVLQELIQASSLPDKCLTAQRPRRLFAAKMFETALKMAAKTALTIAQQTQYGPIYLRSIDN